MAGGFGDSASMRTPGAGGAIQLAPDPFAYHNGDVWVTVTSSVEAEANVGTDDVNRGDATAHTSSEIKTIGPTISQTLEVQRTVGDAKSSDTSGSASGAAGSAAMIKVYDIDDNDYFAYKGFMKVSAEPTAHRSSSSARSFR